MERNANIGAELPTKTRRGRKALKIIALLLGAAALFTGVSNAIVVVSGGGRIVARSEARKTDAIIVLGAHVWNSGQPSYMLQDRLDVAYELYRASVAPKILVSGDHGTKDYDEVNSMRRYLEKKGVPREVIFMDHAGFDTYDTMYRAREVFIVRRAVVVTQRYHLYRALYLAGSMGIEAQGVACDRYRSAKQFYYDLREIAARSKDFILAILKPTPKFLGDELPISGSGLVTWDGE